MPKAHRSQSDRIQPEESDLLNYVELEAEFSHIVRHLDGDDTNPHLLPSEDSHLRSELINLAEKLVDLSRSAAFAKLEPNDPIKQFAKAARQYLDSSAQSSREMTETEPAFAGEPREKPDDHGILKITPSELWAERKTGRAENPAAFIRRVYAEYLEAGALERADLRTIDFPLADAFSTWVTRHPEDKAIFPTTPKKQALSAAERASNYRARRMSFTRD